MLNIRISTCRASQADLRGSLRDSAVDRIGATLCMGGGSEHPSMVSSQHFHPGLPYRTRDLRGTQERVPGRRTRTWPQVRQTSSSTAYASRPKRRPPKSRSSRTLLAM
jgi:hypothetical protein